MSPDFGSLAAFALASFLIELTPGPNMTYLAIVTVAQGRRAGFATVAGVALGLAVIGVAGALGATAAITASDLAWQALRWGGIAFLLYLAWEGWRGEKAEETSSETGYGKHFMRGLMTNLLNPKAAAFYMTVLPGFVTGTGTILSQTLLLTAVYVAVATAIHAGIVLLAGSARTLLTSTPRITTVRRVMAVLLAGVAVWLAFTTGRPDV